MTNWKRYRRGRGWRYECDGTISIERMSGTPRTKGEPTTMRRLETDYGEHIAEASERFGISTATIASVIILESVPIKGSFSRNPNSYRWEERIQEPSVGLMQTLVSTARAMDKYYKLGLAPNGKTLKDPRTSILLGTAYLARQAERYETTDGVLLQAAFNAGGVYYSKFSKGPDGKPVPNEWHMRTHAADRTERFIKWHNDWIQK